MEYALHEPVQATTSFEQACEEVKKADFSLVVLDQWMSEVSPAGTDSLFRNLGRAVPVLVNFAITGMDRVVAIVRSALERHVVEIHTARESASTMLRAQFKDDVTAVLLSCAVALQEPTLTPAAAERIKNVEELANRIRYKLQAGDTGKAGKAAHA